MFKIIDYFNFCCFSYWSNLNNPEYETLRCRAANRVSEVLGVLNKWQSGKIVKMPSIAVIG